MSNNLYTIIVSTDGLETWRNTFDNCVDAVNSYNKFVDHGFASRETVVLLAEPNGKLHNKIFPYPIQ